MIKFILLIKISVNKLDQLTSLRNFHILNEQKYVSWKFEVRVLLTEFKVTKLINRRIPETISDAWADAELTANCVINSVLGASYICFAGVSSQKRFLIT